MILFTDSTKVTKLHKDAKLPVYANEKSDSGADVFSIDNYTLQPGERKLIKTGIAIALPDRYECQVRSKSGLALKKGLMVLNSPGTVDNGYRGEIGVILYNASNETQLIEKGDKIAQLVIVQVEQTQFIEVNKLPEDTSRGESGFGSTGR